MNSLYKKIALVCLVSLTANQAAQAFQFSDVLSWFKGNQKKSVALVVGLAVIAGALCYWRTTLSFDNTSLSPVTMYANIDSPLLGQEQRPGVGVEGVAMENILPQSQLTEEEKRRLNALCNRNIILEMARDRNYFVRVVRDQSNNNRIVGCIAYAQPELSDRTDIRFLAVDKEYSHNDKVRYSLLYPLLKSPRDIKTYDDATYHFTKNILIDCVDGNSHRWNTLEERNGRSFNRSYLRQQPRVGEPVNLAQEARAAVVAPEEPINGEA